MHTFFENFYQGGKYSTQIAIYQEEFENIRKIIDQNHYLYLTYKLVI